MGSEEIKKDLQLFQASLKRLSSGISKAASLWSDDKYSELSSSVRELANQSKEIVVIGERSCSALDKFSKIANEKY